MKITNPYHTTIKANHEQPLESKKMESSESNSSKQIVSPPIENSNKESKTEVSFSKEVKQIMSEFKNKIPLTSEAIKQLSNYVEKTPGTIEQKLETVKMLLNKNLELNAIHLKAIHQALHGKADIKKATVETLLQQLKENEDSIKNTDKSKVFSSTSTPTQNTNTETKNLASLNKSLLKGMIKYANETFQQGRSLDHTIHILLNQLDQNSFIHKELTSKIKTALSETIHYKEENRDVPRSEKQAQEYLLDKLQGIHQEVEGTKEPQLANVRTQDNSNSAVVAHQELSNPINLQSKDIIVNTITKRLAEASLLFKDLKREIARNIDQVTTLTLQTDKNIYQNVKSLLESAIHKLDHAILKSDIVYLTDMKTEKTLMQASSRLAEAKAHLENGNQTKATDILREVKQTMDQLKWLPSDTKIKHFVANESLFLEDSNINSWTSKYTDIAKSQTKHEGSAKGMFEWIRTQGLNHDSEMAQVLAFNKLDAQQEDLQKNMKAVIMKVLENGGSEGKSPEVRQTAENILLNITGQQLLSKHDTHSNMQSMFFNLPHLLGEKVENIKVYINSRKDGEKMDWENSSLYFLIETKKLGETGILVSSSNRNLSITIKNDNPSIQHKLETVVKKYKERIEEIGYQVNGIHFKKLNDEQENKSFNYQVSSTEKKAPPIDYYKQNKEGYDFRI